MSLICIPLIETDIKSLLKKIELSSPKADIIEIWLGEIFPNSGDFKNNGNNFLDQIFTLKNNLKIPLLINVKDAKEKGNFEGTDEEKTNILIECVNRGAEYIDIDYQFNLEFLTKLKNATVENNTTLILSAHFFEGTPTFPSLKNRVERMINSGADMVKFAVMPETNKDLITILRLSENLKRKNVAFITMSMGSIGKISRVLTPLLGGEIMFAPLMPEEASAPGQICRDDLVKYWEEFKF